MDFKEALEVFGLNDYNESFWADEAEVIECAEAFLDSIEKGTTSWEAIKKENGL